MDMEDLAKWQELVEFRRDLCDGIGAGGGSLEELLTELLSMDEEALDGEADQLQQLETRLVEEMTYWADEHQYFQCARESPQLDAAIADVAVGELLGPRFNNLYEAMGYAKALDLYMDADSHPNSKVVIYLFSARSDGTGDPLWNVWDSVDGMLAREGSESHD